MSTRFRSDRRIWFFSALLVLGCACVPPPIECVSDSYQCWGDTVEYCDGGRWVVEETCDVMACRVESSVGFCLEDEAEGS